MLKIPSFTTNTRPETFVPLIHCVIDDTVPSYARSSSGASSVHDVTNVMSVATVSIHASTPKDIVAFILTQQCTHN